jgi:hypothetical protein
VQRMTDREKDRHDGGADRSQRALGPHGKGDASTIKPIRLKPPPGPQPSSKSIEANDTPPDISDGEVRE